MVRPVHIVPPLLVAVALVGAAVGLAGCGGSHKQAPASTASPAASSATDRWGTTWLCRPDLADNPCLTDQAATLVEANGATRVEQSAPAAHPRVDCFYVYPTISDEPTVNADLAVGFRQEEVAIAQASRFSRVCRVYAPVYRQITLNALAHPARSPSRTRSSPTAACSPPSATTSPTTTTAAGSSSSATRRARRS